MTNDDRSSYVLGDSRSELVRLERQARFYAPATEALFATAGIGKGMRVLDVGSGAGDVSMLAARLVGPEGAVTGIERSPQAIETARMRARAAGLDQCRFEEADIDAFATDERYDAIVGRLIVLYLPDPAATMRRLWGLLKPGGVMAFQELALSAMLYHPQLPLLDMCAGYIRAAFARTGGDLDAGLKLFDSFRRAGLPDPNMQAWMPVVSAADLEGFRIMASLMRTLLPVLEKFGIATAQDIGIDTLEERMLAEVSARGVMLLWSPLVGAWVRRGA
jgi:ubiquinone/menaquinone biosynthesis C-methylase UbiE